MKWKPFMLKGWQKVRGRFQSENPAAVWDRTPTQPPRPHFFFNWMKTNQKRSCPNCRASPYIWPSSSLHSERTKPRGTNLCLVLHNTCAPTHAVLMIGWKKKGKEPLCSKKLAVSNLWPTEDTYSVFSLVPLKAWASIWLNPFRTRFLLRTQIH